MLSFFVLNGIAQAQTPWDTSGNIGSCSNFIGTTGNYPFLFRTNNVERMRIQPNGFVGIGVANPLQRLEVFRNLRVRGNIYVDQNVFQQDQFASDSIDAGLINASNMTARRIDVDSLKSYVYVMDELSKFVGTAKFEELLKANQGIYIGSEADYVASPIVPTDSNIKLEVRNGDAKFDGNVNISSGLKIPTINNYLNGYPQTPGSVRLISVDEIGQFKPTTVEVKYGSCPSNPVLALKARPGEALISFIDGTTLYGPNLNHSDDIVKCPIEGNVGIGTLTPNYKLDILEEVNANGYFINGLPFSTLWQNLGNGNIKYNEGNVGIGTENPLEKLHVEGRLFTKALRIGDISSNSGNEDIIIHKQSSGSKISLTNDAFGSNSAAKFILSSGNGAGRLIGQGSLLFFMNAENNNSNSQFRIIKEDSNDGGNATNILTIENNGNSHFSGEITTKAIKVCSAGWCDYVFEKDYKLMPLAEVEKFILKNKHLPEVPSALEILNNQADLFELIKIQMKKIEELTLHTINLQKQIDQLNK